MGAVISFPLLKLWGFSMIDFILIVSVLAFFGLGVASVRALERI